MYLLNAFSLNMLPAGMAKVTFSDVTLEHARAPVAHGFDSAVGHADVLRVPVPCNRASVKIPPRAYGVAPWQALVGQYSGPRLPEGAKTLPEGAVIRWVTMYVE